MITSNCFVIGFNVHATGKMSCLVLKARAKSLRQEGKKHQWRNKFYCFVKWISYACEVDSKTLVLMLTAYAGRKLNFLLFIFSGQQKLLRLTSQQSAETR